MTTSAIDYRKVVDMKRYRILKEQRAALADYRMQIQTMNKSDLLNELLTYHEKFMKNPLDIRATLQGQELMAVLEVRAELTELKDLSREFKAKLEHRLNQQIHARR